MTIAVDSGRKATKQTNKRRDGRKHRQSENSKPTTKFARGIKTKERISIITLISSPTSRLNEVQREMSSQLLPSTLQVFL